MPDTAAGHVAPTVAFKTLGCKVNRVESEQTAARLLASGWRVADPDAADVIVVNTCTVTGEADAKARKEIRRALAAAGSPYVVVTGCLAAVAPDEVARLGERVVVVEDRDHVAGAVAALLGERVAPGGERPSSTHADFRTRAMVKIQDGCDAWCAYCIVPTARGSATSRAADAIVAEVDSLASAGVGEVVLTGINLGKYRDRGTDLASLVTELAGRGPRIRLSSIEPGDLTPALLDVLARSVARREACPHLHVPLQSGSDRVLAAMGRDYDTGTFARHVGEAAAAIPALALTTDVIAGLPSETEAEAGETLTFAREMGFQRLHVFRYSARAGTRAAAMPDQVDPRVRTRRAADLRRLSDTLFEEYRASRVGAGASVLVEKASRGTSEDHLAVRVVGAVPRVSSVVEVRLVGVEADAMIGEAATGEARTP